MGDHSNIEWTDATWNPIRGMGLNRWMCQKISPGCDHCYASTMNHRWGGQEYKPGDRADHDVDRVMNAAGAPNFVRLDEKMLGAPLTWKQPRRVFVCSMTDLFGDWVPDYWIDQIFAVMAWAPQHQFQVLTKRPRRMLEYLTLRGRLAEIENAKCDVCVRSGGFCGYPGDDCGLLADTTLPLPNVWLGVSIESDQFSWRAGVLRQIPAAVRFISAEPLLGPLPTLRTVGRGLEGIDWLIAGGESGAGHRPLDIEWVRELRDLCRVMNTAFFFKQHGGRTHAEGGCLLDGVEHKEFPMPRELAHV